ncbi:arginine-tRNA-protein transferase [Xylariaceae sp. FL0662B]|nr:arginine-tRNA-protein transferase [Xylariaceae sp. FL0662B]
MQETPGDAFFYVMPIGYRKSSGNCGYCRRRQTGRSYYARAKSMSPASYQSLIDRCWRRSGALVYRPNQRDACCPHYTIRLDSSQFKATKDQRQAVNRFNKYVIGDTYAREAARLYPKSREQARKRDNEFDLVERIHECESTSLRQPPAPSHTFCVTLEPDDFTEEKYRIYENYQRVVHHESPSSISREGFRNFLCSSPLKREKLTTSNGKERQLGSFHHCYRLDGQLVAIGVLDLLPECVSSVYYLYHESIHKFSPGKLGALQEIALAMEGGYRWWYPGFYIDTCPKMRYKIDYSPEQILNPESMKWHDLDENILAKFDDHGYLDFSKVEENSTRNDPHAEETTAMEVEVQDNASSMDETGNDTEITLFNSDMPGIPSIGQVSSFDLDHIVVRLDRFDCYAADFFDWHDERIEDGKSVKAAVAELVAAVGLELSQNLALDLRSSRRH